MSSDVISCLQIDKQIDSNRLIVVKEIENASSAFVLASVLEHSIKNGHGIVLVSLHSSFDHYKNVCLKMKCNLLQVKDDAFQFYDLGDEFYQSVLDDNNLSLENVCDKIKNYVSSIPEDRAVVDVIFDGLSHLFDLKYTLSEVNRFCREMIKFTRKRRGYLILHCNVAGENDVTDVMSNLLAHHAYTLLEVENLPSGQSADVSGRLVIRHPGERFLNKENMFCMEPKSSMYLFKLFDRGVKLFAPGAV